jgi:small ligand-binding sensory domain FIST
MGNTIYEMDGRPAYDMLQESMAHIECDHPEQMTQQIFLGVPLKSFQTDFVTSPYLVRDILGMNAKKGMLTCPGPISEGEFVTFAIQDPAYARRNMEEMLEDLRDRILPDKPAFGFYFNSCTRGKNLYGKPNVDTGLIRSYFPDTPLIGFFSYGEIAPVDFVNHLHHHAGVLTFWVPEG